MATTRTPEPALRAAELLIDLVDQRNHIEEQIHTQVLAIIKAGGSWTTIADAMGVSKQAAWGRYHPRPGRFEYVHPDDAPRP